MKIDIQQYSHNDKSFVVTYKTDKITIDEDVDGTSEVEELRDAFVQAAEDLSYGEVDYLTRVLRDSDEDAIISYIVKRSGLEYLISEIAHQTGEDITINNEEEI